MDKPDDQSLERLRERTIDQLTAGYSHDLLAEEEFMQRLDGANSATTHSELRNLILDLPAIQIADPPDPSTAPARRTNRHVDHPAPAAAGSARKEETVVAIFSGTDRKGVWSAPPLLNAVAVFGGSDIDLRDAAIPVQGMTIRAAPGCA